MWHQWQKQQVGEFGKPNFAFSFAFSRLIMHKLDKEITFSVLGCFYFSPHLKL